MKRFDIELEGKHYDGISPIGRPASLVLTDNEVSLTCGDNTFFYSCKALRVSPRVGNADRFIQLPDGGQYQCADQEVLDHLPQEVKSEGPVAWLENHIPFSIACIIITIITLISGYKYGMPVIAEVLVEKIPVETEISVGDYAIKWFEDQNWLTASGLESKVRQKITNKFIELHKGLRISPYAKLEFRNSEIFGPNAFALPGGCIIVTDQLIHFAESEDEILAILAHELGHTEKRHGMRQILHGSLVALVATAITADAATLSGAVAGLPVMMAQRKYSRNFEAEADDFAFDLLTRNGISVQAFINIMERFDTVETGSPFSFMSTHPVTRDRIRHAKELSPDSGAKVIENTALPAENHIEK